MESEQDTDGFGHHIMLTDYNLLEHISIDDDSLNSNYNVLVLV